MGDTKQLVDHNQLHNMLKRVRAECLKPVPAVGVDVVVPVVDSVPPAPVAVEEKQVVTEVATVVNGEEEDDTIEVDLVDLNNQIKHTIVDAMADVKNTLHDVNQGFLSHFADFSERREQLQRDISRIVTNLNTVLSRVDNIESIVTDLLSAVADDAGSAAAESEIVLDDPEPATAVTNEREADATPVVTPVVTPEATPLADAAPVYETVVCDTSFTSDSKEQLARDIAAAFTRPALQKECTERGFDCKTLRKIQLADLLIT